MAKLEYKDNVVEYYTFDGAKQSTNENGITVCFDIDDLTIKDAAGMLQDQLNGHVFKNGVVFENKVIEMFEQLCRNCKFVAGRVEEECRRAKKEGRAPNLSQFPLFKDYKCKNPRLMYKEPVDIALGLYAGATFLKEHYFEERDVCLEVDTHAKGYVPRYNMVEENKYLNTCKGIIETSREAFRAINEYCLGEVKRLSAEAEAKNVDGKPLVKPDYREMVNMNSNDVTKRNKAAAADYDKLSEEEKKALAIKHQRYLLYDKAIEDVQNSVDIVDRIDDVYNNRFVFTNPSERYINYDKIYSEENLDPRAVKLIEAALNDPNVKAVLFASHYNGEYEGIPKVALLEGRFKGVKGIILVRFHDKEHKGGRRDRSCKMVYVVAYDGGEVDEYLLADDSIPNCVSANQLGSLGLLFKPLTDAERIKEQHTCLGCPRMLDYDVNRFSMFIRTFAEEHRRKKAKREAKREHEKLYKQVREYYPSDEEGQKTKVLGSEKRNWFGRLK